MAKIKNWSRLQSKESKITKRLWKNEVTGKLLKLVKTGKPYTNVDKWTDYQVIKQPPSGRGGTSLGSYKSISKAQDRCMSYMKNNLKG